MALVVGNAEILKESDMTNEKYLGICQHWQIVTLLELLESHVCEFWVAAGVIGQAIITLERDSALTTNSGPAIGEALGTLRREAEIAGLPYVLKQIDRISDWLDTEGRAGDIRDLKLLLQEILYRAYDELQTRCFVVIPFEYLEHYKQSGPVFGANVHDAFPLAAEDLSEAGRCLALGRYTASVFHLMRAMECAVQTLSIKLGITNVDREWGKLLSDITQKIEAFPKGDLRDQWSEVRTNLYHVKQAWRNNTMHPKQTYTESEAKAIFDAVRVFMNDLVPLV